MSTAILSDNSVVVRATGYVVHVDVPQAAIHVRAPNAKDVLGRLDVASYPMASAERVRVRPHGQGRFRLHLVLTGGVEIDLGDDLSQELGLMTGRAIADVARCTLDVGRAGVGVFGARTRVRIRPCFRPFSPMRDRRWPSTEHRGSLCARCVRQQRPSQRLRSPFQTRSRLTMFEPDGLRGETR